MAPTLQSFCPDILSCIKLYIGESVLATAFGIIIGPHCANVFNPRSWSTTSNTITLEVMRVTLATGLFAIGVELPQAYLARHWKSLTIMVVPTMAIGWVTSAGFIFALFPGLSFISAMCISACLTPTDPVSLSPSRSQNLLTRLKILAVAITSGKYALNHVPSNIRNRESRPCSFKLQPLNHTSRKLLLQNPLQTTDWHIPF